ncbi:MAG: plasmid pRiA4b ORF-3 family protein [Acidimicrobiia bacterium]|nr:plasmid pRiA4b ORF-3 family protein [Acidimicrobiia bacterium]
MLFGEPDEDDDWTIDERKVTVKQVLPRVGAALVWQYDFGDSWAHDLVVETIEELEAERYPVCLAGERACPPEDCGGVTGFERLVEALADPLDDEHEDMVTWAPDGYDPAEFDTAAATKAMRSAAR